MVGLFNKKKTEDIDDYHKELLQELPSLGLWHHTIDLGYGLTTNPNQEAAYNPEMRWKLIEPYIPNDLNGKTVLDLGCNSGFFSVKMKQRGASKVVAVEYVPNAIAQTKFLAKWFKVDLEIVQEEAHVFCLTTEERFDYVIYMGLFYHLKYPILVLDRLAEMTKSKLFFQTIFVPPNIPDFIPKENYTKEEQNTLINSLDFPRMMFLEKKFNNNLSTWWVSNQAVVISFLRSARLKIIAKLEKGIYVCEPDNPYGKKVYSKLVFPKHGKFDWYLPK